MRTDSSCMISSLVLPIFVLILFGAMSSRAAPGDLDTTFGVGGKVIDSSDYDVWDVDIQTDGKIVTVGTANGSFLTARYNADGSPDSTFGTNGRAVTSFGADDSGATAAAIKPMERSWLW